MTRLAFWGVLASWFFGFCISLILMLVAIVLRDSPPHWELLLTVLACTAAPFLAGRGVARRANGRELPAAFAVLTLKVVFCVLWVQLSALQVRRGWQPYPGIDHAFAVLCTESLFVMAGATVYRLRILAARKDASQRWGRYLGI